MTPPARLLFPAIRWDSRSGFDGATEAIAAALDLGVGGFILFGGEADAVAALTASLRARAAHPLLIGADLERGAGQQFRGATPLPPLAAIASLDDRDTTRRAGALTAREALALGVDWVYGPVCDLDVEPDNPIVGTRSPGSSPDLAARHVAAWIEGCQGEGALACAKHFPGHGRTTTDSHAELPRVTASRDVLEEDLRPFEAAIHAGVASVMSAHVAFPAFDPAGAPATLSAPILRDLLRDALGFGGIVVTDALIMEGVLAGPADEDEAAPAEDGAAAHRNGNRAAPAEDHGAAPADDAGPAQDAAPASDAGPANDATAASAGARASVRALAAGCDALLYPDDPAGVAHAIERALASGRLDPDRLERSAARIDAAARAAEAFREGARAWGTETDRSWALSVGVRSLVPLAGDTRLGDGPVVVHDVDDDLGGPYPPPPRTGLPDALRAAGREVAHHPDPRADRARDAGTSDAKIQNASSPAATTPDALRGPDGGHAPARNHVIAVYADVRAWKGRPGLSDHAVRRVAELLAAAPEAAILVFAHPRLAGVLPGKRLLAAWGGEPIMQEAAAEHLLDR